MDGCRFDGCGRRTFCKGLCRTHYNQQRVGEELRPIKRPGRPLSAETKEDFFWSRVDKSADCWNWTGKTTTLGYGQIKYRGLVEAAHRYSLTLQLGPLPAGSVVDHLCHNPSCVNPDHLRIATHTQNMQNRKGPHKNNKSGVRGVSFDASKGKWVAQVRANNHKWTRAFLTLEEAEKAVIQRRAEVHST